ncbi:hypothetical protein HDA32_005110 [Spinactinospora alkalitolerans]|uniref:Chaplin domain-containing protein n=1 Tax=Spinactinospora alkalitolerans TaxID=687207 RepID=A0A852U7T7_9ACTN|nr:chaplin family protein [Spinactinospora alkalitolerans]NYE49990.1 hypothetical protein [Spinactinospora alkalitolerans]
MRKWVRTSARTALITAGFIAMGTGVSLADSHPVTSGDGSVGSGNQLVANADVPVNVCGNAVAVIGNAGAFCQDVGAVVHDRAGGDDIETSGEGSVLSGNQAVADLEVPVNVCGNAVSVIGNAGAFCEDVGAAVIDQSGHKGHKGHRDHQLAPAEIEGATGSSENVSLSRTAELAGSTEPLRSESRDAMAGPARHQNGGDIETSGEGSVGSGNQAVVDAEVPVNVCGNAVSVVGNAGAFCEDVGAAVIDQSGHKGHKGHRDHQLAQAPETAQLGGDLTEAPVELPVSAQNADTDAVGAAREAMRQEAPQELSGMPQLTLPTDGLPTDGLLDGVPTGL